MSKSKLSVLHLCTCTGTATGAGEQLGKLYAVLFKRRGKVLSEELLEGTNSFRIKALLPVSDVAKPGLLYGFLYVSCVDCVGCCCVVVEPGPDRLRKASGLPVTYGRRLRAQVRVSPLI